MEVMFADDFNASRQFPLSIPNDVAIETAEACQRELHKYPKKESLHIISHYCPVGSNFKILGLNFDCRLIIRDAILGLTSEMRWRVRSILRTQRYHTIANPLHLHKAKVLSYCEYRTAASYDACTSLL